MYFLHFLCLPQCGRCCPTEHSSIVLVLTWISSHATLRKMRSLPGNYMQNDHRDSQLTLSHLWLDYFQLFSLPPPFLFFFLSSFLLSFLTLSSHLWYYFFLHLSVKTINLKVLVVHLFPRVKKGEEVLLKKCKHI